MTHVDQIHPRIQAVNLETGELTPFFFKYLVQLWERTGGPDDFVASIENSQLEFYGDSNLNEARIEIENLRKESATESSSSRITELENQVADLKKELALSPLWITPQNIEDFQLLSTAIAYTTTGKQIIIVTSNVTITLNTNPKNKETVIVVRVTTAGTVTIDAGAKTVAGGATYDLIVNYEAVQIVYSYPDDEWVIV